MIVSIVRLILRSFFLGSFLRRVDVGRVTKLVHLGRVVRVAPPSCVIVRSKTKSRGPKTPKMEDHDTYKAWVRGRIPVKVTFGRKPEIREKPAQNMAVFAGSLRGCGA